MGVDEVKVESADSAVSNGDDDKASDLESKIIKQVEYYFGDCNLASDKFMQQKIKLDDGWIPLEILTTFNRLKNLSADFEVIVKALKKSSNDLVEISEDGQKLRRNPEKPLPEKSPDQMEALIARSVYLKGFPQDSTLDQLMEFFKDKGNIQKIYMRKKQNSKNFKGSIFLTFGTKDEAQEFMKLESIQYRNKDLLKELSVDYHARKDVEYKKRLEDREKRKTEREKKRAKDSDDKNEGDAKGSDKEEDEEEDTGSKVDVKGCILKLTGLGDRTTWEAIRKVFEKHADIAFVDYSQGDKEGLVRFKQGDAQKAMDAVQTEGSDPKTVSIDGKEVTMEVLEGDVEEAYWKKMKKMKEELMKKRREKGRRGGYRGGRGRGRGGYRKRSHDGHRDRSEPSRKSPRTE